MKITDCDISRRAQIALYKRGFTTVEKLKNSDVIYDLLESLKCEPKNLVDEISNLVSIVQSGKTPNSIKGNSIASGVGLDYPKNLYNSMVKILQKDNHPALKKLPFTDKNCTANVLKTLNSLIISRNRVLSDDDRKLLIYRYLLLYTTKDVAEKFGIIVAKQDKSFDKKLKVIFDKIAKRLCFIYGSEDIEDMGISLETVITLYNVGIRTKSDLLKSDLPEVLARRNVDKSILNEISALVKEISCGGKIVDFSVLNPNKEYPYNIFLDVLKEHCISSSYENNFNKVINIFLSDECNIISEGGKLLLYKKYKELKDIKTISKDMGISIYKVHRKYVMTLLRLAISTRKLYHSDKSIFKLNTYDMKKILLSKDI